MKKILLSSLLVCSLFASEQNYIELGGGVIKTKDNFSTDSKDMISSLETASYETKGIPYIEFFYAYDINEQVKLYVDSDYFGLDIGSKIDTRHGSFDFGISANLDEEWKNPYLSGSKREKTDTEEFGVYLGYGLSFNPQHEGTIRYEISEKEYDTDSLTGDLKRAGTRHNLAFKNMYHSQLLGKQTSYLGNLFIEEFNADGESNSYDKYGIEIGTSTALNDALRLSLLVNFGKQDYKKHNSEVNQKVNVKLYGINAILNWDKPLGYKDTYVSLKTGYQQEDANTDFYDKEYTYGILSLGYKF